MTEHGTTAPTAGDAPGQGVRFRPEMAPSAFLAEWMRDHGLSGIEQKTFEEYYYSYLHTFTPLMRATYDRRLEPALRILRGLPADARVLEIGSGCGTESLYFAMQGAHVTGVEVVDRMVSTAQRRKALLEQALGRPLHAEFLHANIMEFQPDAPYDLIWMEEAFHHLEPRDQVVQRIAGLLKPGGYVAIAEGNPFNALLQVQLLRVRGWPRVEERRDASGKTYQFGVERILTPHRLDRWLRAQGVAMVELEFQRFFPNIARDSRLLTWLDDAGHRWLPTFLKRWFCVHYGYVGMRRAPASGGA